MGLRWPLLPHWRFLVGHDIKSKGFDGRSMPKDIAEQNWLLTVLLIW